MIRSIRHAVRQLWLSRVFTAAIVLTLALGIGGATAIFSLIEAVMLRPLPVSEPARLYRVGDGDDTVAAGRHGRWGFFSFPLYQRLQAAMPEFEDITAFGLASPLSVRRGGTTEPARPLGAEYVSGTYFSTLGVGAFSGRVLGADDDRPSAPPVLVLSHHTWQSAYGADPSVVGSALVVEGHPFTVVGVAARGFFGETVRANPPDLWIPLQQEPMIGGTGSLMHQSVSPWLAVMGRLRRDASITGMAPRLTEILRRWIQDDAGYPSNWRSDIIRDLPRQTIDVVPAGAGIGFGGLSAKEQYGPSLQILFVVCGLVVVIGCANVANLLLARAVRQRTQTAVRLAIGASRRQIVAEALTESVLLALGGGIAGLLVSVGAAQLLIGLAFRNSRFVPIATTPSLAVLAFAIVLSLVTGILFGAAPAWCATRTDPIDALRGSGRSTGQHSRARTTLLIVQATLSVVIVAGSTMLTRSLANLENQDFGYRTEGRVLIGLTRLPATYAPRQLSSVYRDIEQRLARLPDVGGVGLALYNPLTSVWRETVLVAGHPPNASDESVATWDRISADYLQNLGITPVRGRAFTAGDNETTAPVAVVNEAFVKRFFKADEDPMDQHFGVEQAANASMFRIVGIVRDAKFVRSGLNRPAPPMFYVPLAQGGDDDRSDYRRMLSRLSFFIQGIVVVTDSPVGRLEPLLRRTLAEADQNLTITSVRTMQQQIDLSFDRERAVARLAELFGIVALLLAAVGVYGVTSCLVAQQRNEVGIRMALGADRVRVIQFVLDRAFRPVAIGFAVGLPGAAGAARYMAAQLYGVSFWDPFSLSVAAISLACCAFFAAIIPAGRAAAISPMSSLRSE